jgi:uncharacterized protein YjdB
MLQFNDEDFFFNSFFRHFMEACEMTNDRTRFIRRAIVFALAIMLALAAPALASSDGTVKWRALLIGNSSYQQLDDLDSCAYDLSQMKSALKSGSVGYTKTASYSNLTASGLQSAVNGVLTWGADGDDVTVVYYTGHGASSGLAGVDYSTSTGNGIYSFSQMQSALANVPGKVIILLDSCESGGLIGKSASSSTTFTDNAIAAFSGASSGVNSKAITSGDHFHVIASSSQTQSSYSAGNYGLATCALCEAMGWADNGSKAGNKLTTLEGDHDGDLAVTVGEAYTYASGAVSDWLTSYNEAHGTNYTQDMQIYPSGSTQQLITREAAATSETETSKATAASTMNFKKACIAPGMTIQLKLNVTGATKISWSSSKNAVATVDSNGLVTGVNYSYSTIPRIMATYLVGSDSYYTYCDVRVLPARYVVQSIRLKYATLTLQQNKGYTMPVRFTPASARYKGLTWSSDHPEIVKVSSGGRILAVTSSGTATITATATSGVSASVVITAVAQQPTSVKLDKSKLTLIPGGKYILAETVLPAIAGDKSVTWKSSNDAVATVNTDGQVVAKAVGKATISATTVNGKRATCVVTVVKNQSIPRTRPKSTYGKLVSSARKISYNDSGSLVVDMYFYNRTGYTQKIPTPNPGLVVLKLKSGTKIPINVTSTTTRSLRNGVYTIYTFKLNVEDYPQLLGLNLLSSDAWYEAVN